MSYRTLIFGLVVVLLVVLIGLTAQVIAQTAFRAPSPALSPTRSVRVGRQTMERVEAGKI